MIPAQQFRGKQNSGGQERRVVWKRKCPACGAIEDMASYEIAHSTVGDILVSIMPTHTFDLLFEWNPKDELAPLYAEAEIVLKSDIHFKGRDGRTSITTRCASFHEFEAQVEKLRKELSVLLETGRRGFAERDSFRESA